MTLFAVLPLELAPSLQPDIHDSYRPSSGPPTQSCAIVMDSSPADSPTTPSPPRRQPNLPSATIIQGTPNNHGSASRSCRDDTNGSEEQAQRICEDYDEYIRVDLSKHRVYISFEQGLQNLLHVPENWDSPRQEYHRIIRAILRDDGYRKLRDAYFTLCDKPGAVEPSLYEPQANFYNHTISLINRFCNVAHRKEEHRLLHFQRNHPKYIAQGIFQGLNPDITGKFKPLKDRGPLVWPMIVHIEEMKDSDVALDRGRDSPRAKKPDEEDPLSAHRTPCRKTSTSKKRKHEDIGSTANKVPRTSQTPTASTRSNVHSTSPPTENQKTAGARLQCARYLMEMLELSILRSHAFLTLVDRDHLQLMYADRSAVVTTSIINLRTPAGETMFLAMLIAFHRLTPRQWGFLPLVKNSFTLTPSGDTAYHREVDSFTTKRECLKDLELHLQGKIGKQPVRLTLQDIMYHQPGIIGRGTCVIGARCKGIKEWKEQELVVKVSWPGGTRQSEIALLELARKKGEELVEERKARRAVLRKEAEELRGSGKLKEAAAKLGDAQDLVEDLDRHWALNHLPNILYSEDFEIESEKEPMPQTKLAVFFSEADYINGKFNYEVRVLRISIQEKLHKITTLPSLLGYAQAFYDIFLCHRWLYDYPYILHRDISSGNVMYRIIDGKIYGVLNDLDLSSLRKNVDQGDQTSSQRTGTPPYMAIDLLTANTRHLYRHDLESLVYVILLLCCRNKFIPNAPLERLPEPRLNNWFDASVAWHDLAGRKTVFFTQFDTIESFVHPSFQGFIPRLDKLLGAFSRGIGAKIFWRSEVREYKAEQVAGATNRRNMNNNSHAKRVLNVGNGGADADGGGSPKFDDETLDGMVAFPRIAALLSSLNGEELEHRSKDQLGLPEGTITI